MCVSVCVSVCVCLCLHVCACVCVCVCFYMFLCCVFFAGCTFVMEEKATKRKQNRASEAVGDREEVCMCVCARE